MSLTEVIYEDVSSKQKAIKRKGLRTRINGCLKKENRKAVQKRERVKHIWFDGYGGSEIRLKEEVVNMTYKSALAVSPERLIKCTIKKFSNVESILFSNIEFTDEMCKDIISAEPSKIFVRTIGWSKLEFRNCSLPISTENFNELLRTMESVTLNLNNCSFEENLISDLTFYGANSVNLDVFSPYKETKIHMSGDFLLTKMNRKSFDIQLRDCFTEIGMAVLVQIVEEHVINRKSSHIWNFGIVDNKYVKREDIEEWFEDLSNKTKFNYIETKEPTNNASRFYIQFYDSPCQLHFILPEIDL